MAWVSGFRVRPFEKPGSHLLADFLSALAWIGDSRCRMRSLKVCLCMDFTSTKDLLVSFGLIWFATRCPFKATTRRGVVWSVRTGREASDCERVMVVVGLMVAVLLGCFLV